MQQPNEPSPNGAAAVVIGAPRDPSIAVSPPSRFEHGHASDSDEEGRVFEDGRGGGGPLQSTSDLGEPQQDGMESKQIELSSMDESQVSYAKQAASSRDRSHRPAQLCEAGTAPSSPHVDVQRRLTCELDLDIGDSRGRRRPSCRGGAERRRGASD